MQEPPASILSRDEIQRLGDGLLQGFSSLWRRLLQSARNRANRPAGTAGGSLLLQWPVSPEAPGGSRDYPRSRLVQRANWGRAAAPRRPQRQPHQRLHPTRTLLPCPRATRKPSRSCSLHSCGALCPPRVVRGEHRRTRGSWRSASPSRPQRPGPHSASVLLARARRLVPLPSARLLPASFFSCPAQSLPGARDAGRTDLEAMGGFPHLAVLLSGGIGVGSQLLNQASL